MVAVRGSLQIVIIGETVLVAQGYSARWHGKPAPNMVVQKGKRLLLVIPRRRILRTAEPPMIGGP